MKILIVKLSAIGDVIHCLPVAAALKQALPDARVSWLVDKGSAELLVNNPCVDEVITFEGKRWSKDLKNPGSWASVGSDATKFLRDLKGRGFDIALEMQGLFKSGALALASGAKIRIGFNGTREFAESFLTHRIDVGDYFGHDVPVVELNLKIVSALLKLLERPVTTGVPIFTLPPVTGDVQKKIESLLGAESVVEQISRIKHIRNDVSANTSALATSGAPGMVLSSQRVNCVLIPGTTWVTKIWPEEHWYQLGVELARKFNYRLLIIGSKAEAGANADLCAKLNAVENELAVDLTNKTSLLDLAALFHRTELVVGGDTGPLHLAAAVGIPKVVGIYGSTPWRRNGPYGEQCRSVSLQLGCQPCYSKQCKIKTIECLRDLTVDRVIGVVEQIRGTDS